LVLLGAWGAIVPFVGPHFNYAYTPDATWTVNAGRLWLEVLPGAVTFLGGLILIAATSRAIGLWAGWLTAVAGAWFVVGPVISRLWNNGQSQAGTPVGGSTLRAVVEELGFFTGLGVVIVFLGAAALGRFSVIGVRDADVAAAQLAAEPVEQVEPATTTTTDVDNEPRHAAESTTTGTRRPLFGRNADTTDETVATEPGTTRQGRFGRRRTADVDGVDESANTNRIPVQTDNEPVVPERATRD
jgi:hypothetical protein